MSREAIKTDKAPAAIGPYSQGIKASGSLVFTSGQLPIDPSTGQLVTESVAKAAAQSLENVKAILAEAGATLDNVVKATVFMKDMDDFKEMNEVYSKYFNGECPARSAVQVARLPMDALLEIEVIAVL